MLGERIPHWTYLERFMATLNESWQRYPEARIRMREGDLEILAKALSERGFCILGQPRIELLEDGVYIQMGTNTSRSNHIIALPIDIFIPYNVAKLEGHNEQSDIQVDAGSPVPDAEV